MGTHPALSPLRPPRPASPRLLQPDRRGQRHHHRRPHRFHSLSRTQLRSTTTSATPSTWAATSPSPGASYASTNVYYGSGFSNAFPGAPYPGNYLPQHTTFDLSLGKDFGERFTASLTALNVTNHRVEYDNSLTFGGYHWNLPREIYVQLRYRFHY